MVFTLKPMVCGVTTLVCLIIVLNFLNSRCSNLSAYNKLSYRKIYKFGTSQIENQCDITKPSANLNIEYLNSNSSIIFTNRSKQPAPKVKFEDLEKWMSMQSWIYTKLRKTKKRSSSIRIDAKPKNKDKHNLDKSELPEIYSKNLLLCGYPIPVDNVFTPNLTLESLDVIESELKSFLTSGGSYEPKNCIPKDHVAIIITFRDRYSHLTIFLRNLHAFLMNQHIAYRMFLIEQTNGQKFNRAALLNIGFLEALKIYLYDCFIFHDIDLLPLDHRNLYNCPRQPRHMSVAIDKFKFKLPYPNIFGGVTAMRREHFQAVNGFSNLYFGWGGEDDDMYYRLKHAKLYVDRYPANIASYIMLKHPKEKGNPNRYKLLKLRKNFHYTNRFDGISSVNYTIYSMKEYPTYTWCLAELKISN